MTAETQIELGELIREGRTFTVRRGSFGPDRRRVICKTPTDGDGNAAAISRLENEFEITRGLTHPGQVVATDWVEGPDGPILVFPDDGLVSLDRRAAGPADPSRMRDIAIELAGILDDLHGRGIVHRDVKPSNVIVSDDLSTVKLIDYCLAMHAADLANEEPGAFAAQGTAAYMAPEQGGRANLTMDHRADLYSLGITLYELLTGIRPFEGDDPARVLHRHMTELPKAPHAVAEGVPEDLSRAIMTLIEKNPEDRYQTAADFAAAISPGGDGATIPVRLVVPDRLFGRADVLERLTSEIAGGATGPNRIYRISGPSGIGKSALVLDLVGPLMGGGAQFLIGKFDQLDRARPYAPMVQAANLLLRRILSSPAAEVEAWRSRILDAVSPNGQVLLDLLPEYEALIGPQPRISRLGLNEARIRVSMVFRRFFRALSREDAPMVLFLDDLQWSDSASRDLLRLLLCDPDIRNFTLITAYRDNEVGASHPVRQLFDDLREAGLSTTEIALAALQEHDVAALAAACLNHPLEAVGDLARLIWAKTGGNPFFVRQFLFALHRKGLVHFDRAAGGWTWDLSLIKAEEITDNVADLVIDRIRALPAPTREVVQIAACIGADFDLETLALANGCDPEDTARRLASAVSAEVVLPAAQPGEDPGTHYRFQHDRVQEAAVAMLDDEHRARTHARIGRLLLDNATERTPDRYMVTLADHLIAGRDFLDKADRRKLHDLALFAARRTKQANAWDAALSYLDIVAELQGPDAWDTQPAQAFELALERAEAAYLRGTSDLAEQITADLLQRDLDRLDRVQVLELVILIHTSRLAYRKALEVGGEALALLGERLAISPGAPKLMAELVKAKMLLRGRTDESLLNLPPMTEPEKLAIIRVLGLLAAPAYFVELYLLPLIGIRIVTLSVRHGNAPHSAYGYVIYGMLHCAVLGNPVRGRVYGELARRCAAKYGAHDIEGRILMVYAGFIQHWTGTLSETLPVFLEGAERAIAVGDLEYHGYTRYGHASYALMAGQPLPKVADFLADHLAAVTTNTHEKTQRIMQMASASIARMQGLPSPVDFDAKASFALWTEQSDATSLAYFHKFRMLEALMAGNYAEVLRQAQGMQANINGILSMGYQSFYQFYEALASIELARRAATVERKRLTARAWLLTRRLSRWARHAPQTLSHRVVLLRAELDALAGRTDRAIAGYARAVRTAREARALHDIGLFNERVALFYLKAGAEEPAAIYLAEANAAYEIWGGAGWNRALEKRHPELLRRRGRTRGGDASVAESTTSSGQIVDSATLISVASALTKKTSLNEVVEEVMRAMVVNAGADRGLLLLKADGRLNVVAEAGQDGTVSLLSDMAMEDFPGVPAGLVNYVQRSGNRIVLDDARVDPGFSDDPYFRQRSSCSVLCVPLLAKGEVTGVAFLENSRLRGAFTPERCETIAVLGAQAAVSVENAHLFDELRGALERQVELTSAHARFVPHSFLEMMNRPSIADVKLGDHVQAEASILFSDIRGFTRLVESMEPAEAIDFINSYLSRMEPAVQAGGGFVDSYIGDAVMAVFDRGPEAAINAGIEMIRGLREWTRSRTQVDGTPIRIGVGIATGEMMFGTIGAANRLKCGVIGDPVNLASRVEGLTKTYNLGLLITQGTYRALPEPEKFQIREVDLVTVVGRAAPVRLMEVFDADAPDLRAQKARTADDVARGLRLYRSGAMDQAMEIFQQCRAMAPDDTLIPILLQRCQRASALAADPEWDGVERHGRKA